MGFEVPHKTYRLVFDDGDYAGAEVICRSMTMGGLIALQAAPGSEEMQLFADLALVSWNLEADGVALPATMEGLQSIPVEFYRAIVQAWLKAVTTVAAPLDEPSHNGAQYQGPLIPMVTLSDALAS